MKILVGSGNFSGSNLMVSRWLMNMPSHEVKIAAWYRNHRYLDVIDWCIDGLQEVRVGETNIFVQNFGFQGPHVNHTLTETIIDELLVWQPDLVISDCEPFTASLAKVLEVPLWYCSGMLQMIGIEHDRKEVNTKRLDTTKVYLESLPKGDKYLVYSPLCDVASRPFLKDGFEWVRPFAAEPKDTTLDDLTNIQKAVPSGSLLTTGETSLVSDCVYSGQRTFISPSPMDHEQLLNAQLLEWYGCARNVGRPKSIDFMKRLVEEYTKTPVLSIQKWKQIDERLDKYDRTRNRQTQ